MNCHFLKKVDKHLKRSGKTKLAFLESEVVGRTATWEGPFGERRILFCDHATSSRPLKFVENYIFKRILPYFVNEETESTTSGRYIADYILATRQEVRRFANADESYAVLFLGNGSTSAIHRLFHIINASVRDDLCVILGPYEHDSTILAAMASCSEVTRVKEASDGSPDINHLREILEGCVLQRKQPVGVFSAVSNVTGVVTEVDKITKLVHEFYGLCFWDYATGAPYLPINVIDKDRPSYSKDAVFFSPHKFTGGVSTPGILIAKQNLFVNEIPGNLGGRSAAYVTHKTHALKRAIEEREEGEASNTVGIIRSGLTLSLQSFLPQTEIETTSLRISKHLKNAFSKTPNLRILGNPKLKSLPVFAFVIQHGSGFALHHHFVTALLNDLFGIQSRGGCMNAGSYSQSLLGVSDVQAEEYLSFIESDLVQNEGQLVEEIMLRGYSRIALMHSAKDKDVEFVISALQFVAKSGWKFLPAYKYDARSGSWSFDSETVIHQWKRSRICQSNGPFRVSRQERCITFAEELASGMNQSWYYETRVQGCEELTPNALVQRWFLLPSEAFRDL